MMVNFCYQNQMVIHRENDGNFPHLLRYGIASGDVKFKENVESAPANATYTITIRKTIQNQLIEIMGNFF